MNEESKQPEIDPELEARIVALVLGEASDFEREELNRLIALQPKLAEFQLRMQRVHGLLENVGEGEFEAPADDWKLPTDQRNAVLAVIRGEATVSAVAQNLNSSKQQRVAGHRGFLWHVVKVAAGVCVAGIVGVLALPEFFTNQKTTSDLSTEMAWDDARYDREPLSGGTILRFDVDTDTPAAETGVRQRGSVLYTPSPGDSVAALSAIQDTLSSRSILPGNTQPGNTSPGNSSRSDVDSRIPNFRFPEQTIAQNDVGTWEQSGRETTDFQSGPFSAPQTIDSYEIIAGNGREVLSKSLQNRGGDGAEESKPGVLFGSIPEVHAPRDGFDRLAAGLASPDVGDDSDGLMNEVSVPSVAAIRLREAEPDVALGMIGRRLTESATKDKTETPLAAVTDDPAELYDIRITQGIDGLNRTLGPEDVASPQMTSGAGVDFDFNVQDLPALVPGSEPEPPGEPSRMSRDAGRDLARNHVAGPADGNSFHDQRFGIEPKRVDNADQSSTVNKGFGGGGFGGEGLGRPGVNQFLSEHDIGTPADSENGAAVVVEDLSAFRKSAAETLDRSTKQSQRLLFEIEARGEQAESAREPASAQSPMPATGTRGVQPADTERPPVAYFSDHVVAGKNGEAVPSTVREELELQRKSGELALGKKHLSRPGHFSAPDVAHTLNVDSKSMKQPVVTRSAPSAGLNEKTAATEAFSTFSLHVSDVSFKLAFAALGRGEWPEAAKVRIEEFVNAFDYGDPMPGNGQKVACRVEQSIHPFVQQRNLLRVSMRTAATGRAGTTPLRLTLLLDNSGSMERSDRRQTVRRAFALLAQQLAPMDQVTLISFARQPRLLADKVSGADAGRLVQLTDNLPSEGGTNIEAALQLAYEKAREQQTPGAQNRIILLTDGAVNLGNANPQNLSQMVTMMRSTGIAFDAAGISAEGLNDEVLEALTRKGDGRYYLLDSFEDADERFARQIAGALRPSAKNVKVQIEFNPKRVGRYKLLGFEKHILKKDDFRNDKVDAAEMAAAEAGVAMYQFEALPDGTGDVGSVSVRFRDLSTGQMVENRWPIPYEADAPRPDQAAPSLRIATSAALLAAKLRGEPLGESVDLHALSYLISGLPDQHRNDNRVQQLQQMIEQARQLSEK